MIKELRMVDITKRFPGVLANDRVNFDVRSGEIHALLGENGAGKSTLMRQLYGLYKPDGGQIILDGKPTQFNSPNDAIRAVITDRIPATLFPTGGDFVASPQLSAEL